MSEINPEQIKAHIEQMKSKEEYAQYFDEAFIEEQINQFQEKFRVSVGEDYYEYYIKKVEQQSVLTGQDYGHKYGVFFNKLRDAFEKKYHSESVEVQTLIREQWEILQIVFPETRSQKIYFAIRDQLCSFPAEEQQLLSLRDFLYQAMTTFGQQYFYE